MEISVAIPNDLVDVSNGRFLGKTDLGDGSTRWDWRVTEANCRDAGKKDPNFLQSESPLFVGRAIAALAAAPEVQARTGMLFSSWELGRDYGLSDYDGRRRPDWGRHKIDFSTLPPPWLDLFRTGADLEITWLMTLGGRTRKFRQRSRRNSFDLH